MIKKFALFVGIALILTACGEKKKSVPFSAKGKLIGLASLIKLVPGENTVLLQDFFLDPQEIDSVSFPAGVAGTFASEKGEFTLQDAGPQLDPVIEIKAWIADSSYSLFLKRPAQIPVQIQFDPQGKAYQEVQIAGGLNDWNPANSPMTLKDGLWQIDLMLNPGTYPYQIVADGQWMLDPANPDSADNNIGGFNSVLKVGDPQKKASPFVYFEGPLGQKLLLSSDGHLKNWIAAWDNHRLPEDFVSYREDSLLIRIPEMAADKDRSHLRLWAWNENGLANDILIPLDKGKPILEADQLQLSDKHNTRLYFLLVDRFNNGSLDNDRPVQDKRVHAKANYQGGDLEGILQMVQEGYFSDLNMNMLWLSPITQNPQEAYQEYPEPRDWYSGYHGYWPVKSGQVDDRFGTSEDLHQLVDGAHERNLGVILDFVANHVHEEHSLIKAHPEWATPLELPDGRKNIRIWDEQRLTTWFDEFLPSLDFSQPEVVDLQSDSAMFWLKNYHLDGFRHDATKHIPEAFWRALTRKVKEQVVVPEQRPVLQIGETFGSRELIDSYIGAGQLDAQFDFNLYFDARSVFATDNTPFTVLETSLRSSLDMYGYHNLMGNISGNHDMPRFISLAGGALRFDEDPKMAGWEREIGVGNPEAYKRLEMLHAFIFTIPGIPVVYYGDEIGMPGAGDPDNRRMMKFDFLSDEEFEVKSAVTRLAALRKEHLALSYGDLRILHAAESVFAYSRVYHDEGLIVAFNKSTEWQSFQVELPSEQRGKITTAIDGTEGVRNAEKEGVLDFSLPPLSWMILLREPETQKNPN